MQLRDYQQHTVDAVYAQWRERSSTLVVLPTGCGKTVVFSHVIDQGPPGRALVLAHREELITQAADKINRVTGHAPEIEMADMWADKSMFQRARVIVSSIQTQIAGQSGAGRMTRFDPNDFSMVIVDEAHHATAASYRRVLAHYRQNPNLKVLGVTATPDRSDEEALGQIFESVAHVYEIGDAIRDGWLAPIHQQSVTVDTLDFSEIRTTAGDLNRGDLAAVMEAEDNIHRIVDPTIQIAGGRKALVFCASVAQAERTAEVFNRHSPDMARWVCGETPKDQRRQILSEYAAGRFQVLCNVGVLTEGFDDPGVQVVAIARPTKSRALYAQMVGRGTRPLPGIVDVIPDADSRVEAILMSAKPGVDVVDFVGNAGRHKLISCVDVLGGNYSDAVVERAKAKAAATPGADVQQQLELAKEEIEEEEHRAAERERERRKALIARAKYRVERINPFDVLDLRPQQERGWDRGRQPSDAMVAAIDRMTKGKVDGSRMTFTEAKQLIGELISRSKRGECSYAQARLLAQYGYDPHVSRTEATRLIDGIAKGGWKRSATTKPSDVLEGIEAF